MTVDEVSRMILQTNFGLYSSEGYLVHDYEYDAATKVVDNELTHYGILGMKWGVRRTPEQLGHKTSSKKKSLFSKKKKTKAELEAEAAKKAEKAQKKAERKEANAQKKAAAAEKKAAEAARNKVTPTTKKSMKNMSDQELGEAIIRLQQEKQYKELLKSVNAKDPGAIATGVKKLTSGAGGVVSKSVKTAATTVLTAYLTKKANDFIKEASNKKKSGGSSGINLNSLSNPKVKKSGAGNRY